MAETSAQTTAQTNDLVYALDDTPAFTESTFAAIQHVLASFVGIISQP